MEIVINDHRMIEEPEGISWQCIKNDCGFVVLPEHRGHRCMFRPEMYTAKPELKDPVYLEIEMTELYPFILEIESIERTEELCAQDEGSKEYDVVKLTVRVIADLIPSDEYFLNLIGKRLVVVSIEC